MSGGRERTELTLGEVGKLPKGEAHTYIFTPVFGPLSNHLGSDVIVSEAEDLEGGQAIKVLGVYDPRFESEPVSYGGPIRYTLRGIPEDLTAEVGRFVQHSPTSQRANFERIGEDSSE